MSVLVVIRKCPYILYIKVYPYMYLWSEQWAVGIKGSQNNGPSEVWAVRIMTLNHAFLPMHTHE